MTRSRHACRVDPGNMQHITEPRVSPRGVTLAVEGIHDCSLGLSSKRAVASVLDSLPRGGSFSMIIRTIRLIDNHQKCFCGDHDDRKNTPLRTPTLERCVRRLTLKRLILPRKAVKWARAARESVSQIVVLGRAHKVRRRWRQMVWFFLREPTWSGKQI